MENCKLCGQDTIYDTFCGRCQESGKRVGVCADNMQDVFRRLSALEEANEPDYTSARIEELEAENNILIGENAQLKLENTRWKDEAAEWEKENTIKLRRISTQAVTIANYQEWAKQLEFALDKIKRLAFPGATFSRGVIYNLAKEALDRC